MLPIYAHVVRATHGSTVHLPRSHSLKNCLPLGWELVSSSPPHARMLPDLACAHLCSHPQLLCALACTGPHVHCYPPPPPTSGSCSSLPSPLLWSLNFGRGEIMMSHLRSSIHWRFFSELDHFLSFGDVLYTE